MKKDALTMVRYSSFSAIGCVLLFFPPVMNAADDSDVADFSVNLLDEDSLRLDLGTISINKGKQGKIQVRSGEHDVKVLIGKSSCGCVKLEDIKKPTHEIAFRVSPTNIADRFVQQIEFAPVGASALQRITLSGRVVGPVSLSQSTVNFEKSSESQLVLKHDLEDVQIESVHALRGVLLIKSFQSTLDGATAKVLCGISSGQAMEVVRVQFKQNDRTKTLDFTVGVSAKKDFMVVPSIIDCSLVSQHSPAIYTLVLYGDVSWMDGKEPKIFVRIKAADGNWKEMKAEDIGSVSIEQRGERAFRFKLNSFTKHFDQLILSFGERKFVVPTIGKKDD